MSILQLGSALSGIASKVLIGQRTFFTESPLHFKITCVLLAEPLKKKKKIDPVIVRAREERKRKKLEKMIRKREKSGSVLKPIEEMEIPYSIIDEEEIRVRRTVPLSLEESLRRDTLFKKWAHYKLLQSHQDDKLTARIMNSHNKALQELRKESEELYKEAIQIDLGLLPYTATGPTRTPSIPNYESPDGEYTDVTRKFDGE